MCCYYSYKSRVISETTINIFNNKKQYGSKRKKKKKNHILNFEADIQFVVEKAFKVGRTEHYTMSSIKLQCVLSIKTTVMADLTFNINKVKYTGSYLQYMELCLRRFYHKNTFHNEKYCSRFIPAFLPV